MVVVVFVDRLFPVLDHRLGAGDMSFEAKRFRHRGSGSAIPVGDMICLEPGLDAYSVATQ
jgi:hypothetical protein